MPLEEEPDGTLGVGTTKLAVTPSKVWPEGGEVITAPDQLELYSTCVSFPASRDLSINSTGRVLLVPAARRAMRSAKVLRPRGAAET